MGARAGTSPPDIAIATYPEKPAPAPDDQLLVRELEGRGLSVEARPWSARGTPWSRARFVLIRSTWDYFRDRPTFLRWVGSIRRRAAVWNPPRVLRWNTDKSYLARLGRLGIPTVPTLEVRPGASPRIAALVRRLGGDRIVLKPRVSADGFLTGVFGPDGESAARRHLARLLARGPALVQRYLPAVEEHGERSLVYLDGRYSHSVRRTPILAPGGRGGPEPAAVPPPAARDLADRAMDVAGARGLLYARVDVVPDPEGRWRLLELELTEPTLYLDRHPRAPARLAAGVLRRLPPGAG